MEAEHPSALGSGCELPPPGATGRDPSGLRATALWQSAESPCHRAAPLTATATVPAPPQGPYVGGGLAGLAFPLPRAADLGAPGTELGAAARLPTPSAHIPVPAPRVSPGKARPDEVMAAAALTSLSTSPLCVGAPEPGLETWKEALVRAPGSYSSSSNSGDWGWDLASDQSSPSTPSPPLPPEATYFLFGDPTLRKRKSSIQVMFQCLWKSCGKVLSTASGMQRHIRLVHLGRQTEADQSDGEEDFYYTELDIGMDTLTDGLSSLTPVSPTTSMPLTFSHLEPPALPSLLQPGALPPTPMLSSAAAPQACHTGHDYQAGESTDSAWGKVSEHSGHDYQAGESTDSAWGKVSEHSREEQSKGSGSPRDHLSPIYLEPQPTEAQALPAKLGANLRKPRGDAKKCRKVYGTDHRDLWCTACRWKKACQRFLD